MIESNLTVGVMILGERCPWLLSVVPVSPVLNGGVVNTVQAGNLPHQFNGADCAHGWISQLNSE